MRLQQDTASENDRTRPKQDCQVNLFDFLKAAKHRRREVRRICCEFRNVHHKRNGKRKNAAFGKSNGRSCCENPKGKNDRLRLKSVSLAFVEGFINLEFYNV